MRAGRPGPPGDPLSLAQWQREIEQAGGGRLVVVRVETDRAENVLRIPAEFPGRGLVRNFLLDDSFVAQLVRAHALSLNATGEDGLFHFILLNMALAVDWEGLEDSLLAHEFGHAWLHVQGYRSATRLDTPCLATIAGDIVQHVLIREEAGRRGFSAGAYSRRNLESWLDAMESPSHTAPLDPCRRLQALSMWMDAALGEPDWPRRSRFLALFDSRYAALSDPARRLESFIAGLNLWDRTHYEAALHFTLQLLAGVLSQTPGIRL